MTSPTYSPSPAGATLDEIRQNNPELGFAVYAYEALGPVTLEIITPDGELFSFIGPTEADVLARAFPEPPEDPADTTASIFD